MGEPIQYVITKPVSDYEEFYDLVPAKLREELHKIFDSDKFMTVLLHYNE